MYEPDIWVNLLSITQAISGPNVHFARKENASSLKSGQDVLIFDGTGWLWGVQVIPIDLETEEEIANISLESQSYGYVHSLLGLPNERVSKATAKMLGLRIKDPLTQPVLIVPQEKQERKLCQRAVNSCHTKG